MPDPAALIPNSRVAADLTRVARSLRLVRAGAGAGAVRTLPDGRQSIDDVVAADPASVLFPVKRLNETMLQLPPLILDFFEWRLIPAKTVGTMPQTDDHWLRMAVSAQATINEAILNTVPVDVTLFPVTGVSEPVFEWVPTSGGTPSYQSGIPANSPRDYYWYLVHVIDAAIVATIETTFLYGSPPEIFA